MKFTDRFIELIFIGFFTVILFSSCTKKDDVSPIILPPGTLVQYSTEGFVETTKEFYTVELKVLNSLGKTEPLEDLTPKSNKSDAQLIDYIIPKKKESKGLFVIQVNLSRANFTFSSFVLPGVITKPNLATTLAVNLISNYPNKSINDYTEGDIQLLYEKLDELVEKKLKQYLFPEDTTIAAQFRFLQNSAASDIEFLNICNQLDLEFDFDNTGKIDSEPFPFGKQNQFPKLDSVNSTPTSRIVRGYEKEEVLIRGRALDPENDLILYQWTKDDEVLSNSPEETRWMPDYDEGRIEPYPFKLFFTDGGVIQTALWSVVVENKNRIPELTYNCPKEVKEWETFSCVIKGKDWDTEPISFEVSDQGLSARIKVNGQTTDNTSRKVLISNVSEIQIEYTPDNNDALNRAAYIEVKAIDASQGQVVLPFVVSILDINLPPSVIGGATQLPLGGSNHEWDYCANRDPDGQGPYWFFIKVEDPDNSPLLAPRSLNPDKVSVVFGGSLRAEVVQINDPNDPINFIPDNVTGCPASSSEAAYFCFQWKPTEIKKSGTITVQAKDNHGGMGLLQTVSLNAYDRNVQPCMTLSGKSNLLLYDALTTGQVKVDALDDDLDSPVIRFSNISPELVPYLSDCTGTATPLILRQTLFDLNSLFYRVFPTAQEGLSKACIKADLRTNYSGMVQFSRASSHTTSITIPADYTLETSLMSGKRLKYKTATSVTMNPEDLRVLIPVVAIHRTATANSLNRFITSAPQVDMTVTNPSSLSGGGILRFSRTNTSDSVIIPAGLIVSTTELSGPDVSSIQFQTIESKLMNAGVGVLDLASARVHLQANPNEISISTGGVLTGPALTVSNPAIVRETINHSQYALNQTGYTLGSDKFCYNITAEDGATTEIGELNTFSAAPPQSDLTVTNTNAITLRGYVQLSRTNSASPLIVPIGTVLKTINGTQYQTQDVINFGIGETNKSAAIQRINHESPSNSQACVGFSDTNYSPNLITPAGVQVMEGSPLLDFKIEVTDNLADPTLPNDPLDRHEFLFSPLGLAPAGTLLTCRDPGINLSNLNDPPCVPCSDLTGDYFRSSKCYLRFLPSLNDVGLDYSFTLQVKDNGMTFPAGRNNLTTTISLSVGEINDTPQFTNSSYIPLIGNSELNPLDLGSFVENTSSDYFVHAIDVDRTENLKKLAFSIHNQVYDIQSASWISTPSGMSITVVDYNNNPHGTTWGSRNKARITWRPGDYDAKRLAGTQGFVLKINAQDSNVNSTPRLSTYGYFKFTVSNINNPPTIKPFGTNNTLTFISDKFNNLTSSLVTLDSDYSSLGAPVNHTTKISLCQSSSIFSCPTPLAFWPTEITSFNPTYLGNSTIPQCHNGFTPIADLALPKFTQLNSSPEMENSTTLRYRYAMAWCPQKQHIGNHSAYIYVNDNGDKDRNSLSAPLQNLTTPLTVKVVAPIFFESPGRNTSGQVVHYMPQAFANVANYTYPTIVNNSWGNPLEYTLLSKPTGMTINTEGIISWKPTTSQITSSPDVTTWPLIQVKVRDKTRNEWDIVSYRLQVLDPISPINYPPTISDFQPPLNLITVKEKTIQTLQVSASDSNGNPLHYRWYIDNVLKNDSGPIFDYKPSMDDGFIDGDGSGSTLKPGQHSVRVEITDGTATISRSWILSVINTIPNPKLEFQLSSHISGISNLLWGTEIGVSTGSFGSSLNSLVFSGSYFRAGLNRNFIHKVTFSNGIYNSRSQTEALPWSAGYKTQRISSTQPSGTSFNIQLASEPERTGPFNQLMNALNVPSTLGQTSFNPSHLCSGGCPQNLFFGPDSNGVRPMARYFGSTGKHLFFVNEPLDTISWDIDGGAAHSFFTTPSGFQIASLAINSDLMRLYVSTRNVGTQQNRIFVFDLNPIITGTMPILLTASGINVFDGVSTDNRILDLITVPGIPQVFALLPGTGGIAILNDPAPSVPDETNLEYLGIAQIGSSYSDSIGDGRKLIYNSKQGLIYGIAKDAQQVFSLDPITHELKVQATIVAFDELITFPNDGLTLGINKTLGQVYVLR